MTSAKGRPVAKLSNNPAKATGDPASDPGSVDRRWAGHGNLALSNSAPGSRVTGPLPVRERGRGEPALLFLHLFAGSASSWDPVVERLEASCRCVSFDQRGFGAAPPPAPGDALADWVDDAERIAAGLGPFVLVGHSMGGKIATALAARRPAGLAGLVLVAPSPPTPEPIPDRAAMLAAWGNPAAAERTARAICARADDPALRDRLVADSLRTSRQAWEWWTLRGSCEDIAAQAAQIVVPTLVLAGAEDATITPAVIRSEVVPRIPGATFETIPNSRHMAPFDAPDVLAATIGRWSSALRG